MFSIKNNNIYEEIVKKSKFISLIFRVYTKEEVNSILEDTKKKYPNATHYCYGYVINNDIKSSDDNEPLHTAGLPILKSINNNNLNYVLIIIVRYFGGIKLGIGPLTRTYAKMARDVIKKDNIIKLEKGYDITVIFNYDNINEIDYLLSNCNIINKIFNDNITYNVYVDSTTLDNLSKYKVIVNKEIFIEKNWLNNLLCIKI